jgi:hypothetical protein
MTTLAASSLLAVFTSNLALGMAGTLHFSCESDTHVTEVHATETRVRISTVAVRVIGVVAPPADVIVQASFGPKFFPLIVISVEPEKEKEEGITEVTSGSW